MKISVLLLAYILVPHSVKHISAPCDALVEVNGLYGLSCKLGPDKHLRHASINDIIYRACCRADIPAVKEPTGLTGTDGKRPDGSTLVPWSAGKCVLWDVTIADTLAPSYAAISSVSAGLVAEQLLRNIANCPLVIFSYQLLRSPLVLYGQKLTLFLVNLDVAHL